MQLPANELDELIERIDKGDLSAVQLDAKSFLEFASSIKVDLPAALPVVPAQGVALAEIPALEGQEAETPLSSTVSKRCFQTRRRC